MVPELIPVLRSQPAGDWSHKPGSHYFPPGPRVPPQPPRWLYHSICSTATCRLNKKNSKCRQVWYFRRIKTQAGPTCRTPDKSVCTSYNLVNSDFALVKIKQKSYKASFKIHRQKHAPAHRDRQIIRERRSERDRQRDSCSRKLTGCLKLTSNGTPKPTLEERCEPSPSATQPNTNWFILPLSKSRW